MKLFGSKQESNLKAAQEMVEKVISELELSPEENRLQTDDGTPGWGLMRGSAQVFIHILPGAEGEPFNSIKVVSPLITIPEAPQAQLALFRRVLELNALEVTGAAFAVKGDTVQIVIARSTQDLDRSEVKDMILRVGYYADLYDDALVNQFGGKRYSD